MDQAYNNTIYDTVTLLAYAESDEALYRTQKGGYFKLHAMPSQTSSSPHVVKIVSLTSKEAAEEYNRLAIRELDFEEAFPDIDVSEP